MGNCFGKQSSSSENFSGPGRTLGSAPTPGSEPIARPTIPARSSAGKTLGGGDASSDDPRSAAAKAAEVGGSSLNNATARKIVDKHAPREGRWSRFATLVWLWRMVKDAVGAKNQRTERKAEFAAKETSEYHRVPFIHEGHRGKHITQVSLLSTDRRRRAIHYLSLRSLR
ncbi:hypothetical protein EV356DRAFT_503373, partial [Viridothelium virens]